MKVTYSVSIINLTLPNNRNFHRYLSIKTKETHGHLPYTRIKWFEIKTPYPGNAIQH